MNKLSLGPIAKPDLVKVTVALSTDLKADLDAYAAIHARTWSTEPLDAPALIPHILAAFLARDRAFQKARRTHAAGRMAVDGNL